MNTDFPKSVSIRLIRINPWFLLSIEKWLQQSLTIWKRNNGR
jgi:hypothetical protein